MSSVEYFGNMGFSAFDILTFDIFIFDFFIFDILFSTYFRSTFCSSVFFQRIECLAFTLNCDSLNYSPDNFPHLEIDNQLTYFRVDNVGVFKYNMRDNASLS